MDDEERAQRDRERAERQRRRDQRTLATLAREAAALDDLVERADAPLWWAAVRRQAGSYLRHLETYRTGKWHQTVRAELDAHRDRLLARVREADDHLATIDADARDRAERSVGLRIAVIGKGGAGKTVVSSTLSRLLARRGRRVLVVDLDLNPGLSYSLGLGGADIALPDKAVEASDTTVYGWQLRSDLLAREAVEQFAVAGPDGVSVTGLGKIGDPDKESAKHTLTAVMQILRNFGEPGWDVVADLEAGPTTPFERYHSFSDHVALVVGPAWRSAMTARRLQPMVGEGRTTTIVANRFRDEPDHPGLPADVRVPFDPDVAEAERQGLAPLDACPDSPIVGAIDALAEAYLARQVPDPVS